MRAQFKVVDADDGLPLPGAFVFNSSNKLLGMTDANGMAASYKGKVKVSMMSYNSTIVDADLILVINDGQIVETGTHEALLEKQGFYYRLYTSQYAV